MSNNQEIVILLKKVVHCENYIEYIPIDVIEGQYDSETNTFIDKKGTPYQSIIKNQGSHGYYNRVSIAEYKKTYPNLPSALIKALLLYYTKKLTFVLAEEINTNEKAPIILMNKKNSTENPKLALDIDIINFYAEHYPELTLKLSQEYGVKVDEIPHKEEKANTTPKKESITEELNIDSMYTELTENIINQDEPIKQILTAVWKQYNGFSDTQSRNILINGSTGVGKTQTFRILTKMLKLPHFITSATDYSGTGYVGKSTEDMLINLLKNANYDLEKAQKGILIVDEIDKLSESNGKLSQVNQRDVQEGLLKILEDAVIPLTVNGKEYMFDTSKLMVIGLGSWSRINTKSQTPIGFAREEEKKEDKKISREDMVTNGMIEELIGRFPVVVQMNELEYEHFLLILKSKNSILNINKNFFYSKGVELVVEDDALKEIASIAAKQRYGARSLDEIIETALQEASFEIARNPNQYSKLIVTEETIKNQKAYTLVKRKVQ